MSIATISTRDQDGIQAWIAARLSNADGVIGSSLVPADLDGDGTPPSCLDIVRQRDLFDAQTIAVRSSPQTARRQDASPSALDGSRGRYRRAREESLLNAENDYEAIQAWVLTKGATDPDKGLSNTQRAYLREAERLLLWALIERGKPLSSLTHEDCLEYLTFLVNPMPIDRWCGPRNASRWSATWRPFEGPLSPGARRQAVVILNNLFAFLLAKGYLLGNAMAGIRSPRGGEPKIDVGRSFTQRQWSMVEAALAAKPPSMESCRLAFVLHFLYATGLRLGEAVSAKIGDLELVEIDGNEVASVESAAWMLTVQGKGGRIRQVPMPAELLEELRAYLRARGLNTNLQATSNRNLPIIARRRKPYEQLVPGDPRATPNGETLPLSQSALYKILKTFFGGVAAELRVKEDDTDADRFERASTHWLRHTHASHAIAHGMPIEVAQQNLGHASLSVTTVYVRTERDVRIRSVESFWGKVVGRR